MAILPGAWHYRVNAGTGWAGVSILWLGEIESLICTFCLSVAASKTEQICPWDTQAYCWDIKQSTNKETISSLRRELTPTCTLKWSGRSCVQITCHTSGAHPVQHVCPVVRRDSSATKFHRVEIAFILALFYWLKPLPVKDNQSHFVHVVLHNTLSQPNTSTILRVTPTQTSPPPLKHL